VLLGDPHVLVSQKDRNIFNRNSVEQQSNRERIAESMRMAVSDFRNLK
jgi:hypothetical protein